MITRLHRQLAWALILLLTAVETAAAPSSPKITAAAARAAKQSEDIVQRIDALLKRRLTPEPLPRTLPNPFMVVTGVATAQREDSASSGASTEGEVKTASVTSNGAPPDEGPALTTTELLARSAAALKFGGMIQVNDQVQIVINNIPRKEGDIISVNLDNNKVYLRVVRIMPGSITVRLNELEQVIKY